MNIRNRALLTSAIIMLGSPTAASAECPPQRHADEEVIVEVEVILQEAGRLRVPVLSDKVVSVEYAKPDPAIMADGERDPANLMIEQIGLVEDPSA